MYHKIFKPDYKLKDFVECYCVLEGVKEETPIQNTIVPDGMIKMIFHYGNSYKHYSKDKYGTLLPKSFVIGQLTDPYIVGPTGKTGIFMVFFKPNGFSAFTHMLLKKMENTAIPLEKIFGKEGEEIGKNIIHMKKTTERIDCIESFLCDRLEKTKESDSILYSAIEAIFLVGGNAPIDELSQKNNTSPRQLARKFSNTIGLSPKKLSKIIRLQEALRKLGGKNDINLTQVSNQNHYYDQSHFIKDFKEFTGFTPKEFYGNHLKMSLIFDQKD